MAGQRRGQDLGPPVTAHGLGAATAGSVGQAVGEAVTQALADLTGKPGRELRDSRRRKFLGMGSKGLAA